MRTPVWTRSTNSFESSVICTNVPWYLNQCNWNCVAWAERIAVTSIGRAGFSIV